MQRTGLVASAHGLVLVGDRALGSCDVNTAVEATQAFRRQGVRDQVVGAAISRAVTAAQVAVDGQDAGQTGGSVGVEVFEVQTRDRLVAAQAHFTEIAGQAHRRATGPEGRVAGRGSCGRRRGAGDAVVRVDFGFQPETGLQAAAQVFRATHAETAGAQTAGVQLLQRRVAGLDVLQVGIQNAEQRDRGLRNSSAAGQTEDGQGNQSFLHSILLGIHPSHRPIRRGGSPPVRKCAYSTTGLAASGIHGYEIVCCRCRTTTGNMAVTISSYQHVSTECNRTQARPIFLL